MKEIKLAMLGCFVVAGFAGCNLVLSIQGSGVLATEDRDVGEFDQIVLSGSGAGSIVCGGEPKLSVTIDDNLLDLLSTEVNGDTLRLKSVGSYSSSHGAKYDIQTDSLRSLRISGSGKFDIQNYDDESLELSVSGSGQFIVSGSVDTIEVSISGSGKADLSNLVAKKANINISGSGRVTANASESLDVAISGSGRINYIGNPDISQRISGSGKVVQIMSDSTGNTREPKSDPKSEDENNLEDEDEED